MLTVTYEYATSFLNRSFDHVPRCLLTLCFYICGSMYSPVLKDVMDCVLKGVVDSRLYNVLCHFNKGVWIYLG